MLKSVPQGWSPPQGDRIKIKKVFHPFFHPLNKVHIIPPGKILRTSLHVRLKNFYLKKTIMPFSLLSWGLYGSFALIPPLQNTRYNQLRDTEKKIFLKNHINKEIRYFFNESKTYSKVVKRNIYLKISLSLWLNRIDYLQK